VPDLNTVDSGTPLLTSRLWCDDNAGSGLFGVTVSAVGGVAWAASQTIRDVASTSDTPAASDAGKVVTLSSSSATTVTIDGSLDLAAGARIEFIQLGSGQVTFVASGATLNSANGLKIRARHGAASLICVATDSYVLVGDTVVA
jgi:nitrous oxidase accessory protein NosD